MPICKGSGCRRHAVAPAWGQFLEPSGAIIAPVTT